MKKTEEKFLKFVNDKKLISSNDKILVALSGGPDSVFLLYLLNKFRRKFKIDLAALHINHLLRGKSAGRDEEFCGNFCRQFGIRFLSARKNVRKYSREFKISLEEAGRIIRYKELEKVLLKINFNKIATAHNCDDNAETVLLNLIKGAGLKGLSGIPEVRGSVIRPVLSVTKEEILEYLHNRKIEYCTDVTNLEIDYERNFLRHRVIPLIKENINPMFDEAVRRTSEIFKQANQYIEENLKKNTDVVEENNEVLSFHTGPLSKINERLLGFLFKQTIEKKFPVQLSFKDSTKLINLLSSPSGKKINLPGSLIALREREKIEVFFKGNKKKFQQVEISEGSETRINRAIFSIREIKSVPGIFPGNKNKEFISGDNLSTDFVLRRWQPGDRFVPLGLKGSKKVSDFLNDQKIPSGKKEEQLVLTNNGRIVWILGLRIDDRFKVTKSTKKVIQLCLK